MPPHAAAASESGGRSGLTEYSDRLEDGAAVKLKPNSQFSAGDFKPVKMLGRGDMGGVYLVAQRNDDDAPYAMKVMKKGSLRSKRTGDERARTEREILSSVNHTFLPVLHSHFEDENHLFLVMNYCHGGDLNVLRQRQPEKKFSENACRFYVAEVLLALEYLHKKDIVYRDLKPENILIQSSGHIMLTDFDLSRDLSDKKYSKSASVMEVEPVAKEVFLKKKPSRVKAFFACGSPMVLAKTQSIKKKSRVTPEDVHITNVVRDVRRSKRLTDGRANSFVGTEEYIAPEIIWGKGHGLAVDWWTLGVLLHELYYGKTPFKGPGRKDTFYSILCRTLEFPGASADLADLLKKLLVKEPANRLGSNGAEEIKQHPFFSGVDWEALPDVSRAPVVPEPFSWEQIEVDMQSRAKITGAPLKVEFSFYQPTEPEFADVF